MTTLDDNIDLNDDIADIDSIIEKQKRVLRRILDSHIAGSKILVTKMHMGKTLEASPKSIPSYVGALSLETINQKIKMGNEMPFMKEKIDEKTGVLTIDADNVKLLSQRAPDWSRQPALAAYLTAKPFRKFSTILVVYSPNWVNNTKHENWSQGVALKDAIEFEPLDSMGKIGLIDIKDVQLYALDGQHRVMGIRGVSELIDEDQLKYKKKNGEKSNATPLTKNEWLNEFKIDLSSLREILDETMSVEFIPSIIAGETREEATQRLRSVFVALNTYAKKTTKSEAELLDEDNGYSVLASSVATTHPLFTNKTHIKNRVNFKNTTISKTNTYLTTFEAISNSAENYLMNVDRERNERWKPRFSGQVPVRPDNSEVEKAREQYKEYLNYLHQLPIFQSIERGENIVQLREFPDDQNNDESEELKMGHLLLRPIGQQILASAVGQLVNDEGGMKLKDVFDILAQKDKEGKLSAHKPENLWYGVTYNFLKPSMITSSYNQGVASDLFIYLIRGAERSDQEKLLNKVKELRSYTSSNNDKVWRDFSGEEKMFDQGSDRLPI